MSVIATESAKTSDLLVNELWGDLAYCREVITYNGAAKTFSVGTLVASDGTVPVDTVNGTGVVTTTAAANIAGVVLEEVVAPASTATKVVVLKKGPAVVKAGGIKLGLLTAADVKTQLESVGINVLDTI